MSREGPSIWRKLGSVLVPVQLVLDPPFHLGDASARRDYLQAAEKLIHWDSAASSVIDELRKGTRGRHRRNLGRPTDMALVVARHPLPYTLPKTVERLTRGFGGAT